MRHRLPLTLAVGVVLAALATWTPLAGDESEQDEPRPRTTSTFHVTGMTCGGCEFGVRRVVGRLRGIEDVEASYEEERATVTYRSDEVTPDEIIAAIEELGYEAELLSDEERDG